MAPADSRPPSAWPISRRAPSSRSSIATSSARPRPSARSPSRCATAGAASRCRADARRDRAQEHHAHRAHGRRQDGDRAAPRQARGRAVRQGRGLEVHRGRLRRPRRRLDGARPRRDGRLDAARGGARARAPARARARRGAPARRLLPPAPRAQPRSPARPSAWRGAIPLPAIGAEAPDDAAARRRHAREPAQAAARGQARRHEVEIDTSDAAHVVHRRLLRHGHGGDGR